MDNIIAVKNLTRTYASTNGTLKREKKEVKALKGISFKVKKGEVFGLLGPNGAGKTTTIKILTTLLAPTSGEAKLFGQNTFGDEKEIRPRINFIFGGERSLYWRLSARDNLKYFSDLYLVDEKIQEKRIPELLELVGLEARADEKVETYSKGMKQRLQIARGLVNDPEILFLDEPTIGLDPVGARDLRKIIDRLSKEGKTILLTTHYMYEADELCDRVGIINEGQIVALDTPENLKKHKSDVSVLEIRTFGVNNQTKKELEKISGVEAMTVKQNDQIETIQLQCKNCSEVTREAMNLIEEGNLLNINTREATLEDVYLKLVGGKI